ncbi:MAG: hypothetical protein KDI15_00335 [Thiothrix sp.]|nr:hypothetical protein [Thiothrix sp.]HPE61030.1 hypothetical protein [Thiolinea sp.]
MSSRYKVILPLLLVLLTSTASSHAEAGGQTPQIHSVRHFPVIVRNENIAIGLCRIHFDTGKTLEVSCNNGSSLPKQTQTRARL